MTRPFRNDRAKAGFSPYSFVKHDCVEDLVEAQKCAFRIKDDDTTITFIDTNAGDGLGIRKPQQRFVFDSTQDIDGEFSEPTALMLAHLANKSGPARFIACEKDEARRESLRREIIPIVPSAIILEDNRLLLDMRFDKSHAIVVTDPCGFVDLPIPVLQHIGKCTRSADFILTINLAAYYRPKGLGDRFQKKNLWIEEDWTRFAMLFNRKCVARTKHVIQQSNGFRFRLMVVANYFADRINNHPDKWEIYRGGNSGY